MSKLSGRFKVGTSDGDAGDLGDGAVENQPLQESVVSGYTLLFVDDEENVLRALRRIFLEENYEILTAESAAEAIEILEAKRVHLIISDHRMPLMTGAELLKQVKERWPDVIRIMLTGYADVQSIMGAVNEGAVYKFITKPWNDEDLRLTVSLALQQYALIQENRQLKELAKVQKAKIRNYSTLFDMNRGMLGSILLKEGKITKEQLGLALKKHEPGKETIGETLVRMAFTTESSIVQALQKNLRYEYMDLREVRINRHVATFLPKELCERNRLLPIKMDSRQVTIAMADPSDMTKCDNIALMTGLKVVPVIATPTDILNHLTQIYGENAEPEAEALLEDISETEPLDEIDIVIDEEEEKVNLHELIGSSEVPPIIRIVNAIISEAVRFKSSDIHIEPKTKYTVVRFRIDGMLHSKIKIPSTIHAATISRIKILARMDISERRVPQDGRITVKAGTRMVDLRVSTMPTINGEKVVMRVLDKNAAIKQISELGVYPGDLQKINLLINKPQGIIISTGPTGSGKTTLLYSLLNDMLRSTKNFETIEDPVEYFLEGASQVYIREKVGLSFPSVLRATLRQDPDVILVGEIRDYETADVAFKAALTGHMVLTSLHTNNTIASITRLLDMGVKPYLIASAIEGLIAQRLVRKVCKYCAVMEPPDRNLADILSIPEGVLPEQLAVGRGCSRCNQTGYLGRSGIFEVFLMNDDFRHFISSNYKEAELMSMARSAGMTTLIEDGIQKVRAGETTLDELVRVLGAQTRYERECGQCKRKIDAKFNFCPFCGSFRHDVCPSCKVLLEPEWKLCPACGQERNNTTKQ
ncbi:MAG: Flp pilus assembly complex ATPase component TadA [Nitrospirae bacterium]|nr:Flp pilus assembly complex ATPase component TadA [Nitrospirota bacterium]